MAALITHARAVLLALVLAAPAAHADDTVIVGTSSMVSAIDPTPGSNGWSLTSHGISENLFTVNEDGEIVGQVAESVTWVSEYAKGGVDYPDARRARTRATSASPTPTRAAPRRCWTRRAGRWTRRRASA